MQLAKIIMILFIFLVRYSSLSIYIIKQTAIIIITTSVNMFTQCHIIASLIELSVREYGLGPDM